MSFSLFKKKQDSKMFEITKSTVINSLKNINSDKINTSSLTLNSIRKIEFSNEDLSLEISISTTNSEEAKGLIVNQLKKDFTGIKNINLNIIQKSSSKVSTHKDAKKINSQEWLMNHTLKAMGVRTQK